MGRSSLNAKPRSKHENSYEKPTYPHKLKVDLPSVNKSSRSNNKEVIDPGLLTRTSYTNSTIALEHIKKVNIKYFFI